MTLLELLDPDEKVFNAYIPSEQW